MVSVFITVDTEISSPLRENWRDDALRFELDRDFHGRTAEGDFGVGHQIAVLNAHGLRASFFVEALFAHEAGLGPLREMVQTIRGGGQDVQLHLHTEWLGRFRDPPLGRKTGRHIRHFDVDDQARLIGIALAHLTSAGAAGVSAYRAGNFGASWETLTALGRVGLRADTSLNPVHFGGACAMPVAEVPSGLLERDGVLELPVTVFEDRPGHLRPLQVCACSSGEMEAVLLQAARREVPFVVIVTHCFELLKRDKGSRGLWRPSPIRIRRFERLCRFLGERRDLFVTRTFSDPELHEERMRAPHRRLRGSPWLTLRRLAEQAWDRL